MRTLVCFGARHGSGEVEISPTEDLVRCPDENTFPTPPLTPTTPQSRSGPRSGKEEIRLFHSQPFTLGDDDEDFVEDSTVGKIYFEPAQLSQDAAPKFPDIKHAFAKLPPSPASTTSTSHEPRSLAHASSPTSIKPSHTRTSSDRVMAVIEDLEKALALDDSLVQNCPLGRKASDTQASNKKILPRFLRSNNSSLDAAEHNTSLESTKVQLKKKRSSSTTATHRTASTAGSVSSSSSAYNVKKGAGLGRLFPVSPARCSSKKKGDKALLLPKYDNECFMQLDSQRIIKDEPTPRKASKSKSIKVRGFFRRHLLRGCLPTVEVFEDIPPTCTSRDSFGPDGDAMANSHTGITLSSDSEVSHPASKSGPVFQSDEDLIDHLVKVCDNSSSLEEGFNCLQERIRSRSSTSLSSMASLAANTPVNTSGCSFGSSNKRSNDIPRTPSGANARSPHGSPQRNLLDDSIPSFSSFEEFLTSVNDSSYQTSLEAILFEQELDKLTTEELAELLDSEVEKLMQEGLPVEF